jgi:hypothetical protein
LNPRPREAQLEDQKAKKNYIRSSTRKSRKTNKRHEKRQVKPKWQIRAKKSSNTQKAHKTQKLLLNQLHLTLSMQALPLDKHYHVSSLNHPVSKSSTNFVPILSPFGNKLIKHKLRKE